MSNIDKKWLQQTIADMEEHRNLFPGDLDDNHGKVLAALRIALASLEEDGTSANEGTITATLFKPVADLYEVTVPSGRSTTFTKDAAEASDCRVMGWSVQEYVKLERYQAAMLQGADGNSPVIPDGWVLVPVEPTEAMINAYRDALYSDESAVSCIDLYKAMIAAAPTHSGTNDGWVACSERMPGIGTEIFYFCQDDGLRDCGIVSSSNFSGKGDAELYVHAEGYDLRFGADITHWMPLPAAPQRDA